MTVHRFSVTVKVTENYGPMTTSDLLALMAMAHTNGKLPDGFSLDVVGGSSTGLTGRKAAEDKKVWADKILDELKRRQDQDFKAITVAQACLLLDVDLRTTERDKVRDLFGRLYTRGVIKRTRGDNNTWLYHL